MPDAIPTIPDLAGEAYDSFEDVTDDDGDAAHDFADGHVDVYTAARLTWLASNLNRMAYVDDAQAEGLVADDADIAQRVGVGQYARIARSVSPRIRGTARARRGA